jgi:hypothetical protein
MMPEGGAGGERLWAARAGERPVGIAPPGAVNAFPKGGIRRGLQELQEPTT